MQRKISLATLALLGALPLGAVAAEAVQTPADSPAKESAGEYIDDAAITAKIKAAFVRDKDVKATEVKVDTFKGKVQLSGFADSRSQIERAAQVASKVPGVKSVQNDIRLK